MSQSAEQPDSPDAGLQPPALCQHRAMWWCIALAMLFLAFALIGAFEPTEGGMLGAFDFNYYQTDNGEWKYVSRHQSAPGIRYVSFNLRLRRERAKDWERWSELWITATAHDYRSGAISRVSPDEKAQLLRLALSNPEPVMREFAPAIEAVLAGKAERTIGWAYWLYRAAPYVRGALVLGAALLIAGLVRASIVQRHRLALLRANRCPRCRYSMAGLSDGRCPECGLNVGQEIERNRPPVQDDKILL